MKRRTDQKGDEDLSRYSKAQTHIERIMVYCIGVARRDQHAGGRRRRRRRPAPVHWTIEQTLGGRAQRSSREDSTARGLRLVDGRSGEGN